ncbi:MAG TPA: polysaccharide biosynthesis C-terminal domain-containing protein, partial [Candidatus Dormibacteraeota bacterium]|nr:polysaccharide biosynthesis C-terminal domain-containing protein [Candidatus Dormibacteraeota bacterium]
YVFLLQARSMAAQSGGTSDAYGRFTLLVFLASLTSFLVDLGFRPLFIREAARDRALLTPYLNRILSLKLVMAVPALVVLLVAVRLLLPGYEYAVFATLALLLGASFSNQLRATFYATGALNHEFVSTIGETLVLLAATVAVAVLRLDFTFFLWAYAVSYLFTIVYAAVVAVGRFGHRFRFDLDAGRLLEMGRESLPFALTYVISTLYYRVDGVLLNVMAPSADRVGVVGLYGAAYKFLDAATFIPQALMDPVYPALSRLAPRGTGAAGEGGRLEGATVKAYKMLAVAAVPVAVVLVVLADPIIRVTTGGAGYLGAVPLLQVLAVSVLFLFVNNTFIYTLNAMGRQRESTRLAVQSLVLNVALNLVLIPQHSRLFGGAMGAAWATVLTEVGLFVGGWFLLRRHLFPLPWLRSLRGVIPAGVLCALAMGAVTLALGTGIAADGLALVAGMAVYAGGLLLAHAFTPEELALARETATTMLRRRRA